MPWITRDARCLRPFDPSKVKPGGVPYPVWVRGFFLNRPGSNDGLVCAGFVALNGDSTTILLTEEDMAATFLGHHPAPPDLRLPPGNYRAAPFSGGFLHTCREDFYDRVSGCPKRGGRR